MFQLFALEKVLSDPKAKVLVFYPLKALSADQHARWLKIADQAGLPPVAVARIDGDMVPVLRNEALEAARKGCGLKERDACRAVDILEKSPGICSEERIGEMLRDVR